VNDLAIPLANAISSISDIKHELLKMPQYEPKTKHYFHAGMYCREVWRDAGVLIVGKVHKKEHFYIIVSGTILITSGNGKAERVTAPCVIKSEVGTERAVYSETEAVCMTLHVTSSTTVEGAENELVHHDDLSHYGVGNILNKEVLK
jgi:mannose-6-phosphate isomerase-like protein (cupin superfamily)